MFDNLNQNQPSAPASQAGPGANIPTSPAPARPSAPAEDMFASVDPKPRPPVFEKKEAVLDALNPPAQESSHHDLQKVFFLLFIVLILAILGGGGVWAYRYFSQKMSLPQAEEAPVQENVDNSAPANEDAGSVSDAQNEETDAAVSPDDGIDDVSPDQGGINGQDLPDNGMASTADSNSESGQTPAQDTEATTTEEAAAEPADDPLLDSDSDGLTDEEEWKLGTDVNNTDTDNDGLFDREEVKVYKTEPKYPDTDGDTYPDGAEVKGGYNPLGSGRLYGVE